jgi:hypothetical protein
MELVMGKATCTGKEAREDLRSSLQHMRDLVVRLQQDYGYLSHAKNAGDDLISAIETFNQEICADMDQHEENLARGRMTHGGG